MVINVKFLSDNNKYKKYFDTRTVGVEGVGLLIQWCGFADRYLARINARYKIYARLKRKYARYIGTAPLPQYQSDNENRIWFCWLQGLENAPALVKNCYASLCYHVPEREIVVITSENFADYCTLPEYIIEKWQRKKITNTHFSDILRLQLLLENGGIWIDATTYMTGPLPDYLQRSELFLYKTGWFNTDIINIGSWFIKAAPNNLLLAETQALLLRYWKTHNYLCYYFLMHLFFRMVSDAYPNEFEAIPFIHQADQHLLAYEMHKTFDAARFEDIKRISPIHKLTYKIDKLSFEDNNYFQQLDTLFNKDAS